MLSLVADYGDSSESENDSDSDASENSNSPSDVEDVKVMAPNTTLKLPTPDFIVTTDTTTQLPKTSVFTNPFREAENAKQAILEKHVKMVNKQDNVRIINGKKVCWNYRKGRCRFGHNCIYAHDSDVQKSNEELKLDNQPQQTIVYQSDQYSSSTGADEPHESIVTHKRKKHPGLTQGLIPGKKIMKNYRKQHVKVLSNK